MNWIIAYLMIFFSCSKSWGMGKIKYGFAAPNGQTIIETEDKELWTCTTEVCSYINAKKSYYGYSFPTSIGRRGQVKINAKDGAYSLSCPDSEPINLKQLPLINLKSIESKIKQHLIREDKNLIYKPQFLYRLPGDKGYFYMDTRVDERTPDFYRLHIGKEGHMTRTSFKVVRNRDGFFDTVAYLTGYGGFLGIGGAQFFPGTRIRNTVEDGRLGNEAIQWVDETKFDLNQLGVPGIIDVEKTYASPCGPSDSAPAGHPAGRSKGAQ